MRGRCVGLLPSILSCVILANCASTPQATRERDADAKQFVSHPATAAIYVYRNELGADEVDDSVLYVGDRLIGTTLPGAFFRIDVWPGKHVLHGVGHDAGRFELEVRPGEIYFVSLKVLSGNSLFTLKQAQTGRKEVAACCVLLENWAPGQRPLLR